MLKERLISCGEAKLKKVGEKKIKREKVCVFGPCVAVVGLPGGK